MTMMTQFEIFKVTYPEWEKTLEVYKRDDDVYKRIICRWTESLDKEIFDHEYHAVVNVKTGDVYLDCRKRKIFAKHLVLCLTRPIHTIIKTAWHLSIIGPLAVEIFNWVKKRQTGKELAKNTFKSLADIFRTPAYGIAMTIVHLGAMILGCFSPNSLYKTREIAGKLERMMLRVQNFERSNWHLSICFSPLRNLIKDRSGEFVDQSEYQIKNLMTGFAKGSIEFRREKRNPFNDCYRKLPTDKKFISAAAKTD